mmetsp:Transcript_1694/g.6762  ORF Transcript_1694/g.6762 Transcript_1694/m.6762 type:complete len:414 (-) Transcript_1694:1268-2509(-)
MRDLFGGVPPRRRRRVRRVSRGQPAGAAAPACGCLRRHGGRPGAADCGGASLARDHDRRHAHSSCPVGGAVRAVGGPAAPDHLAGGTRVAAGAGPGAGAAVRLAVRVRAQPWSGCAPGLHRGQPAVYGERGHWPRGVPILPGRRGHSACEATHRPARPPPAASPSFRNELRRGRAQLASSAGAPAGGHVRPGGQALADRHERRLRPRCQHGSGAPELRPRVAGKRHRGPAGAGVEPLHGLLGGRARHACACRRGCPGAGHHGRRVGSVRFVLASGIGSRRVHRRRRCHLRSRLLLLPPAGRRDSARQGAIGAASACSQVRHGRGWGSERRCGRRSRQQAGRLTRLQLRQPHAANAAWQGRGPRPLGSCCRCDWGVHAQHGGAGRRFQAHGDPRGARRSHVLACSAPAGGVQAP